MYKLLLRPLLFCFAPEAIHHFTFRALKLLFKLPFMHALARLRWHYTHDKLHRNLLGLHFPNPVGLAAGFDKDAVLTDELAAMGFGFVEIGTLTPQPQAGNPQPRLFRLPADSALINRMGFNNGGVETAVERLRRRKARVIIGGNIGKNKVTPNEKAVDDYVLCFDALFPVVDYFVVNVSSPNTPNLRELQEKEPLTALLQTLQTRNKQQAKPKPILLKIAPDLNESQLNDIADIVQATGLAGIIATNTTISREGLQTSPDALADIGAGGLSGKPLHTRCCEVIRFLRNRCGKDLVIIGVGGIFTPEDAAKTLAAGADLVQVYTGFIYEGAGMVRRINRHLAAL